ncbi:Transferrin-binding protein 2 precursor [Kingella denitrificans]|uniref:Transferrin-binding protein B C-lobe/N-lobe beta-barrel domain-containing protein n=1 Tax=Kingella denitrificans ATCC 33394 TaxID=888741 RepID=F0EYV4_9NEIS|nr:transferrin-binding protein-like solute binding protein [Kingella denitrificans]EGC17712.1 hypothetical protein HMPREF9098_1038 [Kingella denitrificans ATCC 33394]QQB41674.1 transferrin-binding protein-like solute binding protein [Kingella denitrificans]STR12470.1 Transferrin-binding protein 2 precursor [Kingella denitrificans]
MKKTALKTVTVFCTALFGLAACGGSGSSNNTPNFSSNTPSPQPPVVNNSGNGNGNNAPAPQQPTPPATPAPQAQYGGTAYYTENDRSFNEYAQGRGNVPVNGNLSSITVQGREINITTPEAFTESQTLLHMNDSWARGVASHIGDSRLSYTRFGLQMDNTDSLQYRAFAIGSLTPIADVPTSGTARYAGSSVFSSSAISYTTQPANFDVDFGAKTVHGRIHSGLGMPNAVMEFGGTINGASFSGTKDALNMQGNFYGPNAAEMGGTFKGVYAIPGGDLLHVNGSFGAKRQ